MASKGAALRVSGAPLYQPHPRDAIGADYVRAFLFGGFAASFDLKFTAAKIVKF